jgi:hypothetical protein
MPRALFLGVRMPLFMELMIEDMDEVSVVPPSAPAMPDFRTLERILAPCAALSAAPVDVASVDVASVDVAPVEPEELLRRYKLPLPPFMPLAPSMIYPLLLNTLRPFNASRPFSNTILHTTGDNASILE